jgi:hypothetical protein
MRLVRAQAGPSLLAGVTEYARGAMTLSLSHAEAAEALNALCDRLPSIETSSLEDSISPLTAHSPLADDAAYDRYFRVFRALKCEGTAFLRSILIAAAQFHGAMDFVYGSLGAGRFNAVGCGLTALLAQIADIIPLAPVAHCSAEARTAAVEFDQMRRWLLGHHIFVALTQGIIFALENFEAAMRDLDQPRAVTRRRSIFSR